MADNTVINPGAGGDTIASDDIAGVKYPRGKVGFGADGSYVDCSAANPLPVHIADAVLAVSVASLPLPSGAATAARQPTPGSAGSPSPDILTVQGQAGMTPLKVDASATVQPVGGNVASGATDAGSPVKVGGVYRATPPNYADGQRCDLQVDPSGNLKVAIAAGGGSGGIVSNNGTFAVQAAQAGSWTVAANAGSGTFAVSAAALPLPAGAATAANQSTANTSLASIDGKVPPLGQALAAASVPVVLTAAQLSSLTPPTTVTANAGTGTMAVSATALPLPSGASTESTLATLNGKVTACNTGAVTISAALPAGTNALGSVNAQLGTGTIWNGATALTPKFTFLNASASGDTTVVAAVTGKKIRVLAFVLQANGAVNAYFKSATAGAVSSTKYLTQFSGVGRAFCPVGHFETTAGEALALNLSAAVACGADVVYVEV